jgi:hypothetical protein
MGRGGAVLGGVGRREGAPLSVGGGREGLEQGATEEGAGALV